VSSWAEVFLGVIAVATLATAIMQIGAIVVVGRLVRRLISLVDRVEQELKPLLGHLNSIGQEAARAASLASAQIERVDAALTDLTYRLEQTAGVVQASVTGPVKESVAILRGLQAAFNSLRGRRPARPRPGAEGEDALFI
jgi:hypothetical protein